MEPRRDTGSAERHEELRRAQRDTGIHIEHGEIRRATGSTERHEEPRGARRDTGINIEHGEIRRATGNHEETDRSTERHRFIWGTHPGPQTYNLCALPSYGNGSHKQFVSVIVLCSSYSPINLCLQLPCHFKC